MTRRMDQGPRAQSELRVGCLSLRVRKEIMVSEGLDSRLGQRTKAFLLLRAQESVTRKSGFRHTEQKIAGHGHLT